MAYEKDNPRRYIHIYGSSAPDEAESSAGFYDDDDEFFYFNDYDEEDEDLPQQEKQPFNWFLYAFLFTSIAVFAGFIMLLGRIIACPFIRKFANDFDR